MARDTHTEADVLYLLDVSLILGRCLRNLQALLSVRASASEGKTLELILLQVSTWLVETNSFPNSKVICGVDERHVQSQSLWFWFGAVIHAPLHFHLLKKSFKEAEAESRHNISGKPRFQVMVAWVPF